MVDKLSLYIDEIRAKLDLLGAKDVDIKAKINDDGSFAELDAKIAATDAAAGNAGGGFGILGAKVLAIGALAVAAADIAIPAILAVGAAAAGAVAGVAVLGLGFNGVFSALQAQGSPFSNQTGSGGQTAQQRNIQLQQQQLTAAQATRSAQDGLTQAIQTQAKAEKDLHTARVQALQDLQDLQNKVTDNALSQQQAAINLDLAKKALAVTLAAPGAGLAQYADQVAQARLNVATAQQSVNELALQGSRLGPQNQVAQQQGVAGNPNVLSAQQALTDANHKLAEAQQNVTDTALKNKLTAEQTAASFIAAGAGANAYQQALAKLNPLQKQFVGFLVSLKPLFEELKSAASQFLPGLEAGIKKALPAFNPLLDVISNVAKALGNVFVELGKQFNSSSGRQFGAFLSQELPKQIEFLGHVFISLGKIVSNVFQAAAPLIHTVDTAFTGFLDKLTKTTAGAGLKTFFDNLAADIGPIGQAFASLGTLLGAALTAIQPALAPLSNAIKLIATEIAKFLTGPAGKLFVKLFNDLLAALGPLVPMILNLTQAVLSPLETLLDNIVNIGLAPLVKTLTDALQPVLPQISQAFDGLVTALTPLIQPIEQILATFIPLVPLLIQLTLGPLTAMTPLLKLLAGPLDLIAKILNATLAPAIRTVTNLFTDQNKVIHTVFDTVAGFFTKVFNDVMKVFNTVAGPLKTAFSAVWDGVKSVWNDVEGFFKGIGNGIIDIINGLIGLLDDVHIKLPKVHVPGTDINFGGETIGFDIPKIPHLAFGGALAAGELALVGERGPELFIPDRAGHVMDNNRAAKLLQQRHQQVTQHIYGQSDPKMTADLAVRRMAARAV
jgi:phage-related protein